MLVLRPGRRIDWHYRCYSSTAIVHAGNINVMLSGASDTTFGSHGRVNRLATGSGTDSVVSLTNSAIIIELYTLLVAIPHHATLITRYDGTFNTDHRIGFVVWQRSTS